MVLSALVTVRPCAAVLTVGNLRARLDRRQEFWGWDGHEASTVASFSSQIWTAANWGCAGNHDQGCP